MVHNKQLSIAKGIGISLMVIGHSGCPDYLHDFIYSFHMILFYFCSAYFYKLNSFMKNKRHFILHKFYRLYWPYVKWSLIFILLHNLFFHIGFNEERLSYSEIFINIKRAIRGMWQGEHFLGAYWFLLSLLWEILLFSFIKWLDVIFKRKFVAYSLVTLLFLMGIIANKSNVDLYINREMIVLPFFYLGYLLGNRLLPVSELVKRFSPGVAVFALLYLLILPCFNDRVEVGQNLFGCLYMTFVGALSGIYLVLYVSRIIENNILGGYLDYIGKNTLPIMTFHFMGFKILTFLLVFLPNIPQSIIAEWPVPCIFRQFWFLYSIVGICFPLVLLRIKNELVNVKKRC